MPYRVVFHLSEGASSKVRAVLGNVLRTLDELGAEGVQAELVAHGDGITALYRTGNAEAEDIRRLAERGVRFAACQNTMQKRGLAAADLLEVAELVPSGIGEIVRRQAEGWLYVRP